MLLNTFLAVSLYLVSDREHFWNPERLAKHTEAREEGTSKEAPIDFEKLKGKKVLLLVHGYNNTAQEAISSYRLVNMYVSPFYDAVIGYLWPGYDFQLEYFAAKRHVEQLSGRMREHICTLSAVTDHLDILAHSMGNFLVFEALKYTPKAEKQLVRNFYSVAPAIDNESIEKKEKYYHSTQQCQNVYIFYSKRDEVLKFLYSFTELDRALGFGGAENPRKLPKNVEMVDCTNVVAAHSGYFTAFPFYSFIKNQLQNASPSKK